MGVLVGKQLDPKKYKKWNDDCGAVDGQNPFENRAGYDMMHAPLDAFAESDEESEDDSSEDDCSGDKVEDDEVFTVADIPQAFSHFTYTYTKRKLLVCDLQGVLSTTTPPLFELTDPVIHFMSRRKMKSIFGRTDRGYKGRNDFFRTHKCSPLCRMINRRWIRKVGEHQRSSHLDDLEEQISNVAS
uniref:Alpha-type protein kinase domain-containing protein n=1 Tax=Ditylum brightwellii TaxID=49249 RepID=A0A7S4VGU0_9STRA|mmetsp:Transcript_3260/g.3945  ORF Transcript_3260/g.3945 Transcript_3260/m.3945 type:complete len:186 (-) Transcript_3260:431-988(-)